MRLLTALGVACALSLLFGAAGRAAAAPQGVFEDCAGDAGQARCLARLRTIAKGGFRLVLNYSQFYAPAADQLEDAGVPRAQIHQSGLCTASHPETLPSYRRDGRAAGRIAAAIRARR